ncbi:site-specific integrase [Xylanibacter rodentium]|uniref:site-specific integrase n=1 Tax=Xylanibacter rodentium TaxID=2736289 RepID=UPI00258A3C99|nr:site-specific integrase [Xylanibacter rodentium]
MEVETRSTTTKMAFLFSCFTGLRYSDLKQLKWGNIERSQSGMVIRIEAMKKTEKPVTVPLGTNAMAWMPERGDKTPDDFVFDIGTCGGCSSVLKKMAKRAGINKRVSFHTGRHSFATLTLAATNDIATVSRLLGHTSVATTQIYAEVLMEDKIAAVNKLNGIF